MSEVVKIFRSLEKSVKYNEDILRKLREEIKKLQQLIDSEYFNNLNPIDAENAFNQTDKLDLIEKIEEQKKSLQTFLKTEFNKEFFDKLEQKKQEYGKIVYEHNAEEIDPIMFKQVLLYWKINFLDNNWERFEKEITEKFPGYEKRLNKNVFNYWKDEFLNHQWELFFDKVSEKFPNYRERLERLLEDEAELDPIYKNFHQKLDEFHARKNMERKKAHQDALKCVDLQFRDNGWNRLHQSPSNKHYRNDIIYVCFLLELSAEEVIDVMHSCGQPLMPYVDVRDKIILSYFKNRNWNVTLLDNELEEHGYQKLTTII